MSVRHLAAILLLSFPSTALAFECSHSRDHCFVSLWWPTRIIPFSVEVPEDASLPRADVERAVDAAMARWNEIDCSDIELLRTSDAVENRIVIVTRNWDPDRPGAAAITNVHHEVTSGEIRDAVVLVNEPMVGITREDACAGFNDLETVLVHELGHALGIAHPCETEETYPDDPLCPPRRCEDLVLEWEPDERVPTMWPEVSACDRQLATLEADDVAALCTIYPRGSSVRQCYALPEQKQQPLVENASFGCTAIPDSGPDPRPNPALLLLGLLYALRYCFANSASPSATPAAARALRRAIDRAGASLTRR